MAEVIDLATLSFDTRLLLKQTSDVKKEINDLRLRQKELKAQGQENSEEFVRNAAAIKSMSGVYNQLEKTIANNIDASGRLVSTEERLSQALTSQNVTTQNAIDNNKELRQIRKDIDATTEEGRAKIIAINAKINENTAFIKENGDAYEVQKMNIGDYTTQIVKAYKEIEKQKSELQELNTELIEHRDSLEKSSEEYKILNQQIIQNNQQINIYTSELAAARGESDALGASVGLLNGGLGGFIEQSQKAGGAGPLMTTTFAAIRTGIVGATQAGIAFIATPVGATIAAIAAVVALCVGAFKFMQASMNSTEEGSQKLAKITAAVKGVFEGFWKIIKPLGEWLGKAFIAYIEGVGKALDWVTDKIADAMEFLGMEGVAENIRGVKEEIAASAKAAYDLSQAEGELQKAQRESKKVQLEYQKQAEKLRQQRDDETKSVAERIAINNKLGEVLKKQMDSELSIANKRVEVANLRIKSEGKTTEALDALAAAQTEVADIQERITGQESEQLANLNSLRKEAADNEAANQKKIMDARQKALDDLAQKISLELKLLEQLHERNKVSTADDLVQQLANIEAIRTKEIEAAQASYNASKKTANDKLQLQIALNEANQKYIDSQSQAVVDNAQREYDAIVAANQNKLDSSKYFNDEQLRIEKERMDRVAEAERDLNQTRYDEGVISYQEYINAINEIDKENNAAKIQLDEQRKELDDARRITDIENRRAGEALAFEEDMALRMERLEIQKQQELADANKTGADKTLIEAKYAKESEQIEKDAQDAKLATISSSLGAVSELIGKQSAAGKLLAASQATIDTYVAANKALSSVPYPFNYIAMGTTIATGLGNVMKIGNTKTPKAEKGALFSIGGKRHSEGGTMFTGDDGTRFEAEKGEIIGVMNRNAAAHFIGFNNAFPAGGTSVPPQNYFATGGIVSQNNTPGIDMQAFAEAIADATVQAYVQAPAPVIGVKQIIDGVSKQSDVTYDSNF